jgi:drug/metabolite transporter (DMT)-like permease
MTFKSRPVLYTTATLVAFAGNSVVSRLALGHAAIDPASFSTIRLAGGATMLLLVSTATQTERFQLRGSWLSAVMLFLYAVPFSFAYLSLSAGTGALILFGSVQITMILAALRIGERPHLVQWVGLSCALGGLIYLMLPGLAVPSIRGSALMALAGISWGLYSLRGRGTDNPLTQTTSNFVRALPLAIAVSLIARSDAHVSRYGLILAVACGALTSGLGYVLWYSTVRTMTATRAAVVQLMVPVLAAIGGVVFLGETISSRLILSAATVLGGIALALVGGKRFG